MNQEVQQSVREYYSSLNLFLWQDQYIYKQEDNEFIYNDAEAPVGLSFTNEELSMMLIALDVDEYIKSDNTEMEADTYNKYIGTKVYLPNAANEKLMAEVRKKVVSSNANEGSNYNPILDSSIYEV